MGGGRDTTVEGEFGFQIAPMVDVVFVLLLFFMAISGRSVTERFLDVPLGGDLPSDPLKYDLPIILDIDSSGDVFANGQLLSVSRDDHELKKLREQLTTLKKADDQIPVIIRPETEARHERIVEVLAACRAARVGKVSFR